jgi:putative PIN family toxin of toxin-antitoxin system
VNEHEQRWRVYRATFDTNIFVRSIIGKENLANYLISLWRERRFVLVLSQNIIDEVEKVLSRRALRLKYQYTLTEAADLISLLYQANIVELISSVELCRDPKDDKFVDCAISGRVQFLVSYDNDLIDDSELKQALFEFGVEIVDPPNFLQKIQASGINQPNLN